MATAPAAAAKSAPKANAAPKLPVWVWEGRTKSGEVKKGEVEAADEASVQQRLRAMALSNVKIKKKPIQISLKIPGFGGISQKDLVIFTRQFATMIDAGLPLVQCLDILGSQEEDKNFAAVILQTRTDVESGASLADATAAARDFVALESLLDRTPLRSAEHELLLRFPALRGGAEILQAAGGLVRNRRSERALAELLGRARRLVAQND